MGEAIIARIAALEAENARLREALKYAELSGDYAGTFAKVEADARDRADAEVARMRDALKSFARVADALIARSPVVDTDETLLCLGQEWGRETICTIGDLRRARAALTPPEGA
jgi:hypothetical protein